MKSQALGTNTSEAEVQSISVHGIWLYAGGREYFLAYTEYPWFRNATVGHVLNVQLVHNTHLNWPDLDIDLDTDSLEHPEAYPLVFR